MLCVVLRLRPGLAVAAVVLGHALERIVNVLAAANPSGFAALEAYELMAHLLQRARPLGLPPSPADLNF